MTQLVSTYTGEYHLSIIGPDNKVKTAISKKNQLFPAFYKRYVFSENPNSYNRYYINTATIILESPENTALFESPDWYRKIYYDEDGIATKLIGVAGNSEINVTANHLTNPGRLECSIGAAVDTETRIMGIILTSNVDGNIKERVFSCVKFDSVVVANASDLIKISYVVSATEFDEPTIATTTFNDLGAITLSISKLNTKLLKSFANDRYGSSYNSKFITNIGSKVFNNNNAYQVYFHTVYPVISTTPLPHTEINKCSEFNLYSYGPYADISVTGFTSNFTLNFGPKDVGKVLSVVDLKLTIPFAPWTDADMRHIISGTGENNVKFDR